MRDMHGEPCLGSREAAVVTWTNIAFNDRQHLQ